MKTFSLRDRKENLVRFENEEFDLLIIGGGITGAGVARDASLRGMKVALIEANDFASGTSSRSSKLIHGGIRYLENMEFKLVFEALNERTKLFEMAPNLVHPLRFMIPLYTDSRVGMFKMGLGMWLYDALSLFQAPELHERLNARQTSERISAVKSDNLLGSFVYSDAYMDDDLLTIETLRSANEAHAVIVNYVKAIGAEFDERGKIDKVICEDQASKKKILIKAKHVVSCSGPWTDQVGELFDKKWKKILRPTKGVHLTFSKDRLPLSSAVVMGAEKSNRIVFAIPRHEMIIIGTTDTDFSGDPKDVNCSSEDVEYLLNISRQYFPGANLTKEDIIASYAGVRPLVKDDSSSEGKTSREHTILSLDSGITFVAGGKYTTYRLMAEEIVNECLRFFSVETKARLQRCTTDTPLNNYISEDSFNQAIAKVDSLAKKYYKSKNDMVRLVNRFGLEAEKLLQQSEGMSYWEIEALNAIENTMCLNLVDFYARRTHLFLAEKDHGVSKLKLITKIFANYYDWDDSEVIKEKENLNKFMGNELNWK